MSGTVLGTKAPVLGLPQEVFAEICSSLDVTSLENLVLVCQQWTEWMKDDFVWRTCFQRVFGVSEGEFGWMGGESTSWRREYCDRMLTLYRWSRKRAAANRTAVCYRPRETVTNMRCYWDHGIGMIAYPHSGLLTVFDLGTLKAHKPSIHIGRSMGPIVGLICSSMSPYGFLHATDANLDVLLLSNSCKKRVTMKFATSQVHEAPIVQCWMTQTASPKVCQGPDGKIGALSIDNAGWVANWELGGGKLAGKVHVPVSDATTGHTGLVLDLFSDGKDVFVVVGRPVKQSVEIYKWDGKTPESVDEVEDETNPKLPPNLTLLTTIASKVDHLQYLTQYDEKSGMYIITLGGMKVFTVDTHTGQTETLEIPSEGEDGICVVDVTNGSAIKHVAVATHRGAIHVYNLKSAEFVYTIDMNQYGNVIAGSGTTVSDSQQVSIGTVALNSAVLVTVTDSSIISVFDVLSGSHLRTFVPESHRGFKQNRDAFGTRWSPLCTDLSIDPVSTSHRGVMACGVCIESFEQILPENGNSRRQAKRSSKKKTVARGLSQAEMLSIQRAEINDQISTGVEKIKEDKQDVEKREKIVQKYNGSRNGSMGSFSGGERLSEEEQLKLALLMSQDNNVIREDEEEALARALKASLLETQANESFSEEPYENGYEGEEDYYDDYQGDYEEDDEDLKYALELSLAEEASRNHT
ncbi:hypothetical protein CJU89_5607 [Yarrowia sp. B02]|nr:hypothetical protein CJU89_5607 [Yarrowia sp. B02]